MHCGGCRIQGTPHQQAHWFTRGRVGAALISGKCLNVDLLILGFYLFIYPLACHVFLLVLILLLFRGAKSGESRTSADKSVIIIIHRCFNFPSKPVGGKYYNSKLDDSPTTVCYVTANNSSQTGSVIR